MSLPQPPSERQVREFLSKYGPSAKLLAELLQRISPEVRQLITTGVGWELIQDDTRRWEELALKVLRDEATDVERRDSKYLLDRIQKTANKIATYYRAMGVIGGNGQQEKSAG